MAGGSRREKIRPHGPVRWTERRDVEGCGSVEGPSPRALAMTRVLPKKSLEMGVSCASDFP